MALKVVLSGFALNGPNAYLRNPWNFIDFVIVVFAVLSKFPSDIDLNFIKVIRILRVLRPLRMISRNEGLKVAVLSLLNAIPDILNVLVITFLFLLLFGIFGTTYFKGTYHSCLTDNVPDLDMIGKINTKWDCLNLGGEWINSNANFDNALQSMITCFQMATTEGWNLVMWEGVD